MTILGPVAYALVALAATAVASATPATDDIGARHRYCGFRKGITVKVSTGDGDGRTRENRSHEVRIRQCRGFGDPPCHVARHSAAGHDHREVGARESAGPAGPNLEDPGPVRGPIKCQHACQHCSCVEAVDTGLKRHTSEGTCQCFVARHRRETIVLGEEGLHSLLGDPVSSVNRTCDIAVSLRDCCLLYTS